MVPTPSYTRGVAEHTVNYFGPVVKGAVFAYQQITVRNGKGAQDRVTMLLEAFYRTYSLVKEVNACHIAAKVNTPGPIHQVSSLTNAPCEGPSLSGARR